MDVEKKLVKDRVKGELNEIFLCSLCNDVPLGPQECTNCGVIICRDCAKEKKCSCGEAYRMISKVLLKMYSEINISCSNPVCKTVLPIIQIEAHEDKCMASPCLLAQFCNQQNVKKSPYRPFCSIRCSLVNTGLTGKDQKKIYEKVKAIMKQRVVIVPSQKSQSLPMQLEAGPITLPKEKVIWKIMAKTIKYYKNKENVIFINQQGYLYRSAVASFAMTPGRKYYWEIEPLPETESQMKVGISDNKFNIETAFCNHEGGYAFYCSGFLRHHSNSFGEPYGKSIKNEGVIGVFFDTAKGELSFSINGEDQGVAFRDRALSKQTFYAAVSMFKKGGCSINYDRPLPPCYKK